MPLPLSPAARKHITDLAACLSLSNLCFLKRWYDLEHLADRSMDYFRSGPSEPTLLIATVWGVAILGIAFYGLLIAIRYLARGRVLTIARAAGVLILIYPVETIRRYWNLDQGHIDWGSTLALASVEIIMLSGALMVLRGNLRVFRAAERVLAIVIFLLPALLVDLAILRAGAPPASAYANEKPLGWLPAKAGRSDAPRVIWLLFDELDQRLVFDRRPADLYLPEMDRLRRESFVANQVQQTAWFTLSALPSLLTGRIFPGAAAQNVDSLSLEPKSPAANVDWKKQPMVFERIRALGVNAAIVGWHHPYCRLFGDTVSDCYAAPADHFPPLLREEQAAREGTMRTVAYLFRLEWLNLTDLFRMPGNAVTERLKDELVQREQQKHYFAVREQALAKAVDPRVGFLFVHVPAPHLFALYDRKRGDYTLSSTTTYWDNVALVDRTVGELRRTLEQHGMWDSTTLLITADHGLRYPIWRHHMGWTPEFDALFTQGSYQQVPFILKLAGEHESRTYDQSFSAVVTGNMMLAVLRGEIKNAGQACAWIKRETNPSRLSANR